MCNCMGMVVVEPPAQLLLGNTDEITMKENPSNNACRMLGDIFPFATENSPNRVM